MEKTKQIIVVREDLKMPKGKLAAQVSHASLGSLLSLSEKQNNKSFKRIIFEFSENSPLDNWLNGIFTKIVLKCNSEEELKKLKFDANEIGLPHALIKDNGHTFFKEPTYTCIGIGPAYSHEIDRLTKHLKLL